MRLQDPLMKRIATAIVLVFLLAGAYGAIWCYTLWNPASPSMESEDAIRACNRSIRWHPKNGLLYWSRARVYERMGDLETALADYDEAIELFSNPANNWDIRAMCAVQMIDSHNMRDIIEGSLYAMHLGRAQLHLELKSYDSALADCDTIIGIQPRAMIGFLTRGKVHQARGDSELAIADFTKVIESNFPDLTNEAQARREEIVAAIGRTETPISSSTPVPHG